MYHKYTMISGKNAVGEFKSFSPTGHWKLSTAIQYGRRHGIRSNLQIRHDVVDGSGKGRSGHDGRWVVDENDQATKKADWKEYGKEHPGNTPPTL